MAAPALLTAVASVLLVVLMAGAACGDGADADEETGITREQFIDAIVAIRSAEHAVEDMDSADVRFAARRDSILESMELTQEDLDRFLEQHTDLNYMEAVWDSISQRLIRPSKVPLER